MSLGVLTLETYYDADVHDERTVRPLLDLLRTNLDVRFAHRWVARRDDVSWYLENSWAGDQSFDVLYIAAHGRRGGLVDEWDKAMTLDWLTRRLARRCAGRVVYLAACVTVPSPTAAAVSRFMTETGAAALVGYGAEVDWLESAALDLLMLAALAGEAPAGDGTWSRPPAVVLNETCERHPVLMAELKPRVIGDDTSPPARRATPPSGLEGARRAIEAAIADNTISDLERADAIRALGALSDGTSESALRAIARKRGLDPLVRCGALRGLHPERDGHSRRLLSRLINPAEYEEESTVREVAVQTVGGALQRMTPGPVVDKLLAVLCEAIREDPAPTVRQAAVIAVAEKLRPGTWSGPEYETLNHALDDDDPDVSIEAKRKLEDLAS